MTLHDVPGAGKVELSSTFPGLRQLRDSYGYMETRLKVTPKLLKLFFKKSLSMLLDVPTNFQSRFLPTILQLAAQSERYCGHSHTLPQDYHPVPAGSDAIPRGKRLQGTPGCYFLCSTSHGGCTLQGTISLYWTVFPYLLYQLVLSRRHYPHLMR